MKKNVHVLVIEDSRKDALLASRILHGAGVQTLTIFTDVKRAMMYLEDIIDSETRCPDLIMLDLDFGADSGFEVLRLRKEHPELRECKIVVWTGMGQREQELCKLFGVEKVVSKHQGQEGLRKVLSEILQPLTQSAESNP